MNGDARPGDTVRWNAPLARGDLAAQWPRLSAVAERWAKEGPGAGPARIDVAACPRIDSSGLAALLRAGRRVAAAGRPFSVAGLPPHQEETLREAIAAGAAAAPPAAASREGPARRGGDSPLREALAFAGELACGLLRPAWFRIGAFSRAFAAAGPGAAGVTATVGFLLGLVLAFESAAPLKLFGAEIYVANLVGVAVVRELAVLVAAIVMSGRTASAFAAELGTMGAEEEIDALRVLGIPPVRYLAAPRVAAAALAMPPLSLVAGLFALLGGGLVLSAMGYGWSAFWSYALSFGRPADVAVGAAKAAVFGLLVGAVGCHCGLSAGAGSDAVGRAVTRAVVSSIVAVALADGVFAVLLQLHGI